MSVSETLNVMLWDISLLPFFVLSLKHTTSYSLLLLHLEMKIILLTVSCVKMHCKNNQQIILEKLYFKNSFTNDKPPVLTGFLGAIQDASLMCMGHKQLKSPVVKEHF